MAAVRLPDQHALLSPHTPLRMHGMSHDTPVTSTNTEKLLRNFSQATDSADGTEDTNHLNDGPHPEFPDEVSVELYHSPRHRGPFAVLLHPQLGSPAVGDAAFSPPPESGDISGLPARWKPRRIFSDTFSRTRRPATKLGNPRSEPGQLDSLPPLSARPPGCLSRGAREPGAPRNRGAAPGSSRAKPRAGETDAPGPPRPANLLPPPEPPSAPAPARPPSRSRRRAARALGPQKGRRARRRRRRTYRARLAAPPPRSPAAAAASTRAARTHSTWPNSKEPGAGEGAPPRERSVGAGGAGGGPGGGESGKCYNFLPCPPPGRGGRGTRRGEGSARRSANEFTFFFSPALSPSPFPPAPLSLPLGPRGRAGVFGSRRGRRRTAAVREEEEEEEKCRSRESPITRRAGPGCDHL
ncbi:basic salivary proline-rich protein 4-like [Meles meles]|uniref:basic salivary proline-rich protein 4-like n=1 Tax=Meles meles TaxID=9662 RepID=UPI001E69CAA8|nr:basic salivary proline-rich protein 4-like [Meles meles]